jgi:arylsulfatase A-like enzyme/Tfp pilus assembly protein PilF
MLRGGSASRVRTRPSLLLVTIDTLRADRVGAYGSRAGLTPALDRLAAEGWTFENAVSAVPLTLPSHATILSGLDPLHHGVRNNGTSVFPEKIETLATRLKAEGYGTGAFVAAVVLDRMYGLGRGFDVYEDRIERAGAGRSVLESERPCETVTRLAAAWLKGRSEPFFAWVHFYEPHAPYVATPSANGTVLRPEQAYDGEVSKADLCLADIEAAARAAAPQGLLTAVTSDHGEGLGEHGESTHGLLLYQSTLSVPMVIAGPGVAAGKRTASLSRTTDLAPTLLGLLQAPALSGIDGRNLVDAQPLGGAYAESDYAKGFGWNGLRSFRIGALKLIDSKQPELFDLRADPAELRNLASTSPADVDRLRGVLRKAIASEVKTAGKRLDPATEERLRSLGYVSGAPSAMREGGARLDPVAALPLFQDFERAMALEAGGDMTSSIGLLEGLTKRDPENVTFLRSLASALRRKGRHRDARRALDSAAKLSPDDVRIMHDRAVALAEAGEKVQAIESEERAIALDPAFADAFEHLASLRATSGQMDRARDAIDRALALDPNRATAWVIRGNLARARGDGGQATECFERALQLAPDLVDANNGLGVLAVEAGRLDEAAKRFERAIAIDPRFHEARLNLAVVEARRGRIAEAMRLGKETERNADNAELKNRARAFLKDVAGSPR